MAGSGSEVQGSTDSFRCSSQLIALQGYQAGQGVSIDESLRNHGAELDIIVLRVKRDRRGCALAFELGRSDNSASSASSPF